MDLNSTLTAITLGGVATGFISGILSQLWKSSEDVEGRTRKKLTPAGVLAIGIALVGLTGSIASELIRIKIQNDKEVQAKAAAAQKQALQAQEEQWRKDTSQLLADAKQGIEKNLGDTINGFQDQQESSLEDMYKIIVSGQPLTSLSFGLRFTSPDALFWNRMRQGQTAIKNNADSEQGGVPSVPYEAEEYQEALLPLLSFIAHLGDKPNARAPKDSDDSVVALIQLDEAHNAVLSFGDTGRGTWSNTQGDRILSSGFLRPDGLMRDSSVPLVRDVKDSDHVHGVSRYALSWNLDPITLADAIDRTNTSITPTAKLPRVLTVTLLYGMAEIPFQLNNFGQSYAVNLWGPDEIYRQYVTYKREFADVAFVISVNGYQEKSYIYSLKRVYKLELKQEDDDDWDAACTVLEFELKE